MDLTTDRRYGNSWWLDDGFWSMLEYVGAAVTVQLMVVAATTGNDLTVVRVVATTV